MQQHTDQPDTEREPYATPEVMDYGDIQELTAQNKNGGYTDVPMGTKGKHVFS